MESQRAVPVLRRQGRKVVDLSADYRLRDASLYGTWYKAPHIDAAGLAEAVYGLPELHRKAIAQAGLVASPGCYPMGSILATAPLLKSGLGCARRHRDRRQVRRDGSGSAGPEDRAHVPLHRGQRERAGLRARRHPPAHARDRAGALRAGGRAGGGGLHPASPAHEPRALHHRLGAAHARRLHRRPRGAVPGVLRGGALRPGAAGRREAHHAPHRGLELLRRHRGRWMRARGARSASPRSTISARAAPPTASRASTS